MHRVTRLLAVACAAAALLARPDAAVGFEYNFNSDAEGWTFGTILGSGTDAPYWLWDKQPSSEAGGLQAFLSASGSGAGAWAMSPCLELKPGQETIDIDFMHYTLFSSTNILGQVQFRVDTSGTGWTAWQGIDQAYWNGPTTHVPPLELNVFPPLLSSATATGTNVWPAFSGTNVAGGGPGDHVKSGFSIPWSVFGGQIGDEFQMRFVLGVNEDTISSGTAAIWEVNSVGVKTGLQPCPVPEPAALAMVGGAATVGLAVLRSKRRSRRRGGAGRAGIVEEGGGG